MKFTRENIEDFRIELTEVLEKFAKKKKIKIEVGNIVYDKNGDYCDVKLKCSRVVDGVVHTKEQSDFVALASLYGLKPESLGQVFKYGDNEYEIVGLNRRSPKYPVIGKEVKTGIRFRFPADVINKVV